MNPAYTLNFSEIRMKDVPRVGGKNASLGELLIALKPKGVGVLDGFAITTDAYWRLLQEQGLREKLQEIFSRINPEDLDQLAAAGHAARTRILETPLPEELKEAILAAYRDLIARLGREPELAVRSSASAEDLPEASFAGAAETFLNVRGDAALLQAVHQCFASLFTDRAISYRARQGYDQLKVALSIGVMPMVRSDLASSGVIFTLDTESGFRNVVTITGTYGLGEFIVQGVITPDEWLVFKPTLKQGREPIIGRRLGSKEIKLVYGKGTRTTRSEATPPEQRASYCLTDAEVLQLARWSCLIEDHYSQLANRPQPMDIEWAKDGVTGQLFVLQARPETVHSAKLAKGASAEVYQLSAKPPRRWSRGRQWAKKSAPGRCVSLQTCPNFRKSKEEKSWLPRILTRTGNL